MTKWLLGLMVLVSFWSCSSGPSAQDPITLVNPFIGTGGHGHTFPGATAPFGMVQLSPDTRLEGWDGCSGYHYTDSVIYGFSHTHLSGTGVSDYGDVLLMPNIGEVQFDNGEDTGPDSGYSSRFEKSTESASPGFYSVILSEYDIQVELTASVRVGVHRYNLPGRPFHMIIDLEHRDKLTGYQLRVTGPDEISGHRFSEAWATDQKVFFVAQFSKKFANVEFNTDSSKSAVHFPAGTELIVKVALSPVSVENARENLNTEIDHWDFEKVRRETEEKWRTQLNKIEVEGGSEEQRINFYTALYHTMIAPNLFSDVNGQYRGMDGQVHLADHEVYTVFSLWDTFRALHPLFTIIERERTADFIKTFLLHYEQGGRLPVWELAGNETDCMIGYHSVPAVVDAYFKDIDDFDHAKMLKAMIDAANRDHFGLESYRNNGCILAGDEAESVSKTLEYAYDDWCIAQYARAMGDEESYRNFIQRAQYYKNLFDPATGFFRARMDGSWFAPFDPAEVNYNYTEANAWQYSLFVPQDISGLMELHGGADQLEQHLDRMFAASSKTTGRDQADITGLIGQYAHGNEPSHHMAYLYNYTGQPWKTQLRVRQIMDEMYSAQPDGLSGNEDCGQMSAWYVFSAMGLYPVTPGIPEYAIGSPVFDKVKIHLENGKIATISADGDGPYIQKASLNGTEYANNYLRHEVLTEGGHIHFEMGETTNHNWGVEPNQLSKSAIAGSRIAPVPFFESRSATFVDTVTFTLACIAPEAVLYIRLNDGDSLSYSRPILLEEKTTVEAWAVLPGGSESQRIHNTWHRIDGSRSIALNVEFANQYAAGGQNALIDFLRGSENYQTGRWQGYQDQDFEAVVDLGDIQQVNRVAVGFLQDIKSWIWYPPAVTFEVSADGEAYQQIGQVTNDFPDDQYGGYTQDFSTSVNQNVRYIRITAPNYGPCPDWHLGAGGRSWLFADEIVIEKR